MAPYKSDKQRKFFHAAEERGEISPKVVKEFDKASKGKKLPKRVKAGKKPAIHIMVAISKKMQPKPD